MKTLTSWIASGILAAALPLVAHATPIQGSFNVSVWNGYANTNASTNIADLSHQPTDGPIATFIYSGPINFINNNRQGQSNTYAEFFGFGSAGSYDFSSLTNFASGSYSEDQFAALSMSNPGTNAGSDSIATYLQISSTFSAPTGGVQASISHDDGASLYVDNTKIFESASPQTEHTDNFTLAGGSHSFNLVYVEANGAPSDLIFNAPLTASVPEPATVALLGLGLIGLGLSWARRRG